jgi:hypothetical protein
MTAPVREPRRGGEPSADASRRPAGAPRPGAGQRPRDASGLGSGPRAHAGSGPLDGQWARGGWGGPGWVWAEGGADTGPVPACGRPGPQPGSVGPDGLDYGALLAALAAAGVLGGDPGQQDGELAGELAAEAEGRLEACDPARVAALAVEHMVPGAVQAGWLEAAAAGMSALDENALAGVAVAARQAASRAAACELAAVAQITARAAAADPRIGVEADGRPVRVCRDALGQIALALRLTHYGAEGWADLAVTLAWRLSATGQALAVGTVDLARARLIAEATGVLSEQHARAVEQAILPAAGELTRPQLRERLARAVIAADPAAAEQRREQAERAAQVSLYADPDGTATLAGSKLPAVHAAAAMARITAIARAMQAAGQAGGLDLHRARVMLGLLLGTLPHIPPPDGAPPDQPPPDQPPPDPGPGDSGRGPGEPADHDPGPGGPGSCGPDPGPGLGSRLDDAGGASREWDQMPPPGDEDAPPDDGLDDVGPAGPQDQAEEDDDLCLAGPTPAWPELGAIPPALARCPARPQDGRPVPGLLDALLPWTTLAGLAPAPGILGRIGPVTAAQARLLAQAARDDPAAQWRVIVTNAAGQALAVTRLRRPRRGLGRASFGLARAGPTPARDGLAACRDGPPGTGPPGAGLVGRVTVTITQDTIAAVGPAWSAGPGPLGGTAAAALRAAAKALDRALAAAAADQAAGGCAHAGQSPGYRPPPRLREHVIARDVTCRSPVCRQPAWRADLDHTRPYHQNGRTCRCNLGGGCRRDHQLKQHPRWTLRQTRPGYFTWTTPAGRTYTTGPDSYPV